MWGVRRRCRPGPGQRSVYGLWLGSRGQHHSIGGPVCGGKWRSIWSLWKMFFYWFEPSILSSLLIGPMVLITTGRCHSRDILGEVRALRVCLLNNRFLVETKNRRDKLAGRFYSDALRSRLNVPLDWSKSFQVLDLLDGYSGLFVVEKLLQGIRLVRNNTFTITRIKYFLFTRLG
ncbi:hypothetical protein XENOCAPTIV_007754 [Xenoophorus captivus]|uniref:Uncharacterized protein n=1 Tax=Xenoophorus captivus TaxID=1517983 RepID=A0ABV0RPR7_9TELE